jgi:hypothetical protein
MKDEQARDGEFLLRLPPIHPRGIAVSDYEKAEDLADNL